MTASASKWRRFRPSRKMLAFMVAAVGLLGTVAVVAAQKADIGSLTPQAVNVKARSVSFASDPSRKDFGRLEWRGGLALSADNPAFGGYSGLSLSADGTQMLAVSDAGSWLSVRLNYKGGRLSGLSEGRIGPLTQRDGAPIQRKRDRDAETLVALGQGGRQGRYYIGFEDRHRLEEYEFKNGAMKGPLRAIDLPRNLRGMRRNSGLEGATILRGGAHSGALVMFAERKLDRNGDHTGAFVRGGKSYPLSLKRTAGFDVTELASLKDGSLLVLERSFVRASLKLDIRLRLIPAREIRPDARLEGRVLLEADTRYAIDNLEAMDVRETKEGETLIYLMSDDNFNFFQRTLLLMFALKAD